LARLEGKVALVSGSGRGIGRAIALKLAKEGASVVVNDLDTEVGDAVASEVRACGANAIAVNGSVTAEDFGKRFVESALDEFRGIDIVVNNAGYTWDATVQNTSDEQFQEMLAVHIIAPFRILRAAAPHLKRLAKEDEKAGREVFRKVVNISSISGIYGNVGQSSYASGKAALFGLTRTLAKEWGRYKVNVNCVAFGLIGTRLTERIGGNQNAIEIEGRQIKVGVHPNLLDTYQEMIPLGRAGSAEEAAGAVYLFCSPESNYVSGQILVCGGGLLI
jgi:3-oxoacyl-[acyl-carrier protein] reductase